MNRKALFFAVAVSGISALSGCVTHQQPMTPEQKEMARQMQQAFIARMQAGTEKMRSEQKQTRPAEEAPAQEAITEDDLAKRIESVKGSGEAVTIERSRDGLRMGGSPYLDPEGEITNFSANALSGDIVYALKSGANAMKFKYVSAAGTREPVTIGTATKNGNSITFKSVTGKTISGNNVIGTSRGVLVTRQGSAFHYVPGETVTSTVVPEGYHIAPLQKGDFGSTGFILIEKTPAKEGSVSELKGMISSLGSTVGLAEADGYMLLEAESGRTVKLDISTDDKEVQVMSNCKRQNDFVNQCSDMHSYESLYRRDGTRNRGHYFWRVDWMQTPQDPFAVVQEAGTRKINVINLDTEERVTVLERTLGISSHDVYQAPDGKIRIEAQLGFSKESVNDAVLAFEDGLEKQLSQK